MRAQQWAAAALCNLFMHGHRARAALLGEGAPQTISGAISIFTGNGVENADAAGGVVTTELLVGCLANLAAFHEDPVVLSESEQPQPQLQAEPESQPEPEPRPPPASPPLVQGKSRRRASYQARVREANAKAAAEVAELIEWTEAAAVEKQRQAHLAERVEEAELAATAAARAKAWRRMQDGTVPSKDHIVSDTTT
eukprot:COSAG04_NODE_289_length_17842_cov_141.473483_10_plen_196_part_00